MELQLGSLDFSQPISGSGPGTSSQTLVFPRTVTAAIGGACQSHQINTEQIFNFLRCFNRATGDIASAQ